MLPGPEKLSFWPLVNSLPLPSEPELLDMDVPMYFPSTRHSPSEKAMAPHSSTLAWKIPWMEEPGRLQSLGSRRVGRD